MSELFSSVDLNKVLSIQVALSTLTAASTAPVYNLPIFLYGWHSIDQQSSHEIIRQFLSLVVASFVLDWFWMYNYSATTSSIGITIVFFNFVLKPVTLLSGLAYLRQRGGGGGAGGFGGLPGSAGGPLWSTPAGFPSGGGSAPPPGPSPVSHQHSAMAAALGGDPGKGSTATYQGYDEDAPSVVDVEAQAQRLSAAQLNKGQVAPAVPATGGAQAASGYHTLE